MLGFPQKSHGTLPEANSKLPLKTRAEIAPKGSRIIFLNLLEFSGVNLLLVSWRILLFQKKKRKNELHSFGSLLKQLQSDGKWGLSKRFRIIWRS